MTNIRELWQRVTRTRYTRALEAEVARLRAENRALLNSILGIAGIPPVITAEPETFAQTILPGHPRAAASQEGFSVGAQHGSAPLTTGAVPLHRDGNGSANGAAPLRRRSWQQINRMLELDSARKKNPEESL